MENASLLIRAIREIRGETFLVAPGRAAKAAYCVPFYVFPANYFSLYFAVFAVFT
jgi:hypothetical protein